MRRALFFILLMTLNCKPTVRDSNTADAVVRGPAGSMDVSVSTSGVLSLVPGEGERITRVNSVSATMEAVKEPVVVSSSPVPIGTIDIVEAEYELDATSSCKRRFTHGAVPDCEILVGVAGSQPDSKVHSVSQVVTPVVDLVCAAHSGYETKVWQKQFQVSLTGPEKVLMGFREVKYTVLASYGKIFVGSNPANRFDSGSTFLTVKTVQDIDAAVAITVEGKEFQIPRTTFTWTDSASARKAATPCEYTPL